ncbi:ADP-ribosylation factor 1-like isoform X2 [Liolophura sinensis]|uniref:ADP-ribosylation factor 1-like isoform X2 n=1 Tax=Liolophura sinensis TaxID=3198878 RepID=UPI0031588D76
MGNIWSRLFRHREVRIVLVGFNVESFAHRDLQITAWDIGSRDKMRALFRHYYKGADAVVVVIDSSDRERLDELNFDVIKPAIQSEELETATLLFLANKQDLSQAMSVEEITEKLNLKSIVHNWSVFPISALKGTGVSEALDWLACQLGSLQAKKAVVAPVRESPVLEAASSDETDRTPQRKDYCNRAYTAIKCLFKTSRTES